MTMDSPPVFTVPAQPLHPLSPERVNGTRPLSNVSNQSSMTVKSSLRDAFDTENPSPRSSPTRKKANLFANYNPSARADAEQSAFPQPPPAGALPTSPSLPEMNSFRSHVRTNSDVQGLVKRFEHLDVRDREAESNERRKRHELELRRAQVAREEAEDDVKRLREEVRRLKKEGDERRDRERMVGKRLEVVMEEYVRFKETQASQTSVYEKEIRKAKKEAFKSSSAVVKLQEDLKSTRNSLRVTQSNLDMEKRKVQHREQDTFNAQYQLVAVQEELEKMKTHFRIVEEEKGALKKSLQEEEVARIAAEGRIALPPADQDDDEDLLSSPSKQSPRKRPVSPLSDDKENVGVVTKKMIEGKQLREQLALERMRREHAEELADFLRMECQFRCCSCRSNSGGRHESLTASDAFDVAMENIRDTMRGTLTPRMAEPLQANIELERSEGTVVVANPPTVETHDIEIQPTPQHVAIEQLDRSMTMDAENPAADAPKYELPESETPQAPHPTPVDFEMELEEDPIAMSTTKVPLLPSSPQTPPQLQPPTPYHQQQVSVRTITTTTTIPMHFTPVKQVFHETEDAESIRPTEMPISPNHNRTGSAPMIDREAALAAIAYRRGRAKSIANGHITPRKQMIEGVSIKDRRDISAPALGQQKTSSANSTAKGTASVARGVHGSASRRIA